MISKSAKEVIENVADTSGRLNRTRSIPVWPIKHGSVDCPTSGWLPTFDGSIRSAHDQLEASLPFSTSNAKISENLPGASLPQSVAAESPMLPSNETKPFVGKSRASDPDY